MSADNYVAIQRRKDGAWVAQPAGLSWDVPPNPEEAKADQVFDTLENVVRAFAQQGNETEGGLRFPNLNNFGLKVEVVVDDEDRPHIPASQ